jgi:hypothetical protein
LKLPIFQDAVLEDVFEGGLEGGEGIDLALLLWEASKFGWQQQEFDPYREKVAEEMLLCEVIVQFKICIKHHQKQSAYEGAVQQDWKKLFLRGSCRRTSIFKRICLGWSAPSWPTGYGWRENRFVWRDVHTHLWGEWTCRSCAPRHCLEMAQLLADSGGDLKRSGGLQWLLTTYARTYVTVTLKYWQEGCNPAYYMAAIIRRTESEEHKAALYQEAEGCWMISLARARSTLSWQHEVGYAWLAYCNYVKHTALLSLQHRAWTWLWGLLAFTGAEYIEDFEAYTWALQLMS